MFKSVAAIRNASGSQLWHSDGGPGSCVIIAIYLNDTTEKADAQKRLIGLLHYLFLRKKNKFCKFIDQYCDKNSILKDDLGRSKNEILCNFYGEQIDKFYKNCIQNRLENQV